MKQRPSIPCRKSDDILSVMAEAGELQEASAYSVVLAECEQQFKKQRPRWRRYCGHRTVFGEPDPDGYFARLHLAQKDFDARAQVEQQKQDEVKRRAEVFVRRQKMLARQREIRSRHSAFECAIKAGDRRFRLSPTVQFEQDLAADQADARRNLPGAPAAPDCVSNVASANGNHEDAGARGELRKCATQTTVNVTTEVCGEHHRRQRRRSTPELLSLDFDIYEDAPADDRPLDSPASFPCPSRPRETPICASQRTGGIRPLQRSNKSQNRSLPRTFAVYKESGLEPRSVGDQLRAFKRPLSARAPPR